MRFYLRYSKTGRISKTQISKLKKLLEQRYPDLSSVPLRYRKSNFALRERKDGSANVPANIRAKGKSGVLRPVIREGSFQRRYHSRFPIASRKSSTVEQYYYISLTDVADFNMLADEITSNIAADFRKFRRIIKFGYFRLKFIVRDKRPTHASFSFVPSSTIVEKEDITYAYIRNHVVFMLREALNLLNRPYVADVILESHIVNTSAPLYPYVVRQI